MNYKKYLKQHFPNVYEYYQHIQRLRLLKEIKKRKAYSKEERISVLSNVYKNTFGREINWLQPVAYTEKMQIEKIYNDNPMKTRLSDKYLVREWVKEKIGEEYLIPLLGCWIKFDDIDFSSLPNQFVLKTNHGSGSVYIVKNKANLKMKQLRCKFNDWMKMDFAYVTWFEMHYSNMERLIIAEKYLESSIGELQDYKFLCFDGKPCFCWVDLGRFSKHTRTVFDMNWDRQPWTQAEYGVAEEIIPKPENFELMKELATTLCQGFKHVRVDLYNVNGKIYFGEMTFTNGSGLDRIVPDKYDFELGKMWNLDKEKE